MSSPTTTPPKTGKEAPKPGYSPAQQGWLSRQLGVEAPWNDKVKVGDTEMDPDTAKTKAKEFDKLLASGDPIDEEQKKQGEALKKALAAAGIPGIVEQAEEFENTRKKKDEALKKVRDLLELQKTEMSQATDLTFVVKGSKVPFFEHKKKTKSKDNDIRDEFSTERHTGRLVAGKGPTPQQLAALKLVIDQLYALTDQLRDEGDSPFSPNELMEEIWTPLIREHIISEDQCPQEFSRVMQLWEGANALYRERCKEKAREEEERFKTARTVIDDIESVVGISASVIDVVLTLVGAGPKAKEILDLASKCARAGANLLSNALAGELKGCTTNVGAILGAAVPKPWGDVSKAAFLTVANGGLIAQKLAQRETKEAGKLFGDALGAAFDCIGSSLSADKKDDNKMKDLFGRIGGHLSAAVSTAINSKDIYDLLQENPVDSKKLMEAIGGIVDTEVKRVTKELVKELKQEKQLEELKKKHGGDEESPEYKKELKELEKSQEKETEDIEGFDIEGLGEKLAAVIGTSPNLDLIEKAAIEAGAEQSNEELEAAHETYCKSLSLALGVGVGADDKDMALLSDLYDIDKLIAQIEADKAQIALLNGILDAVGGVITMIIPQLGGVLKAKQFAMNVVAAVRRSQELCTFTDLVSDAKKAASPQSYALLAQVSELKRQLTSEVIDAAVNLGQAILITGAAAADLSGYGAAAGAAMKAASGLLDAFATAKEKLSEKFQQAKVKRAWKRYRKALDNPRDRISVVRSLASNPTLAKYAVAYGAIEMNDPFAKEALRACNLNDAVLADEGTNAEKVVRYLEAKFSDDIQVVGVVTRFAPDSGDPMTLNSWIANKKAAMVETNNVVLNPKSPTPAIDKAFTLLEVSRTEVTTLDIGEATTYDQWETHIANLTMLATSLTSFTPLSKDGGPFPEFQDYLNDLANSATMEAKKTRARIDGDKAGRKKSAKMLQTAIATSKTTVDAIEAAITDMGVVDVSRTTVELTEYCTSGEGGKLTRTIRGATGEAPALIAPCEMLSKSLKLAVRRAESAGKLAMPEQGVQVKKIFDELSTEMSLAQVEIRKVETSTQEKLTALGPDALLP